MGSERARPPARRARTLAGVVAAARALLAILLAKGALSFLLHGQAVFAHLGRPDEARIAIAVIELLGALLFLWRRTALAGGVVLSLLLAWVAGFHFGVGWDSSMLLLFLAAVLGLIALTRRTQTVPAGGAE
jgi:hypothetical protein